MAFDSHSTVRAFIMAAFRVILVVVCILTLFCLIYRAPLLPLFDLISNMHTMSKYTMRVQIINIFIAASVGIYGAYAGNPKYLKWFALLLSIYVVFTLLETTIYIMATDRDNEMAKFSAMMQDYAKEYQSDLSPDKEPNEPTKSWDLLQESLGCCGLYGPRDWKHWRYNTSSIGDRLPESCCVKVPGSLPEICTTSSPYVDDYGCREAIEDLLSMCIFPVVVVESLIVLIVAAIALVVAKDIVESRPNIAKQSGDKLYILS